MSKAKAPDLCQACSGSETHCVFGMQQLKCNNPDCQKEFVRHTLALDDMLKQMDLELFYEMDLQPPREDYALAKRMAKVFLQEIVLPFDGMESPSDLSPLTPEEQNVIQAAYSLYFDKLLSSTVGSGVQGGEFRNQLVSVFSDAQFMRSVQSNVNTHKTIEARTPIHVAMSLLLRQSEFVMAKSYATWVLGHQLMTNAILPPLILAVQSVKHEKPAFLAPSSEVQELWRQIEPYWMERLNGEQPVRNHSFDPSKLDPSKLDPEFKINVSYFIAGLLDYFRFAPEGKSTNERLMFNPNEADVIQHVLQAIFDEDYAIDKVEYFMSEIQAYFKASLPKQTRISGYGYLDVSMSQSLLLTFGLLFRVSIKQDVLNEACIQIKRGLEKELPFLTTKNHKSIDAIIRYFNEVALQDSLQRTEGVIAEEPPPQPLSKKPYRPQRPNSRHVELILMIGDQNVTFGTSKKHCNSRWIRQYVGDDSKYWSQDSQLDLVKAGEEWFVIPNPSATNDTMLNGRKITQTTKLYDNDIIGVGKESKGIVKTPIGVRLPYGVRPNHTAQSSASVIYTPPASESPPQMSTSTTSEQVTLGTTESSPENKLIPQEESSDAIVHVAHPEFSETIESPTSTASTPVPVESEEQTAAGSKPDVEVSQPKSSTADSHPSENIFSRITNSLLGRAAENTSEPSEKQVTDTAEEPVKEWTPPALETCALYEKLEEQETMVERLRTKRLYNRDSLDELTARLADWEGLLSKMAFVSQSMNTRKLDSPSQGVLVLTPDDFPEETDVWFVGDVHGDLLGFLAVLDAMEQYRHDTGRDFKAVFMGDLVDDGHDMNDIVAEVVDRIIKYPERYVWVAGNHDEAIYEHEGQFAASVHPAGYADWLNAEGTQALGKAYIKLVENLPRAILFPKGLMCSHAGFPQDDVSEAIMTAGDASALDVLAMLDDKSTNTGRKAQQDFVWCRITKNPKRRVNRLSKGAQVGARNFETFSQALTPIQTLTGAKLNWIVRGHDHCDERQARWQRVDNRWWNERFLTINNMSFDMRNTGFACPHFNRFPVVARWNSNPENTPFPVPRAIVIPESLVHKYAPLCKAHMHSSNPRYDGFFANKMDSTECTGMIEVDGGEKRCGAKIPSK